MTTLEILIAARAQVEKGWCQGALNDGNGNCCALGAIDRAAGGWTGAGSRYDQHLIAAFPPGNWSHVAEFNNDPATTKADVIACFDRAINAEAAKLAPVIDPAHVHPQAA